MQRRLEMDRRHGEVFPLPCPKEVEQISLSGAPHYCRQRWNRRREQHGRVQESVLSLNRLAAAVAHPHCSPCYNFGSRPPTSLQRDVLLDLRRRVESYGRRPAHLDGRRALRELLATKDLYGQDPQHLARFDMSKLKVARGSVSPKLAQTLLPDYAMHFLKHFDTLIERDTQSLQDVVADPAFPQPYWDPVLRRSRSELRRLLRVLADIGLVSFRRRAKAWVGLFFVHKVNKDPPEIRMIVDGCQPSRCHQLPPKVALGSPAALCEVDLSAEGLGSAARTSLESGGFAEFSDDTFSPHGADKDVNDAFYNILVREMGSWFCMKEQMTGQEVLEWGITQIYDDQARCMTAVKADDLLWPCFEGLSMGWSWSLFFCQAMVESLATKYHPRGPESLIQERRPPPLLRPGAAVTGVYVDNVNTFGWTKADAEEADDQFAIAAKEAGIGIHGDKAGKTLLDTLGVHFDFESRRVRHRPSRAWRLYLASSGLLALRAVHPKELCIWLGHAINYCALQPSMMSCFQHCYAFIHDRRSAKRRPLTAAVVDEIYLFRGLIFTVEFVMDAPCLEEVMVGDSATHGMALLSGFAPRPAVLAELRWRERWRFRDVELLSARPALSVGAIEWLGGLSPSSPGDDTAAESYADTTFLGQEAGAGLGAQTTFGKWLLSSAEAGRRRIGCECQSGGQSSYLRPPLTSPIPTTTIELSGSIPRISASWARMRWRTLVKRPWKWPSEHINLKEGRVTLLGLRRLCRSRHALGTKSLGLTDNMVSLLCFEKGRSRVWGLNALCRRACAYKVALNHRQRLRHIISKENPADEGSRLWEPRGPPVVVSSAKLGNNVVSGSAMRGNSPSASSAPKLIRTPVKDNSKCFIELFSGLGSLSATLASVGLNIGPVFDIKNGPQYDLTRRSTQQWVLSLIRSGRVWAIHLGTPCTIWSVARRGVRNLQKA